MESYKEQLEIRISNLEQVIAILEQELCLLLEEYDRANRQKIGFRYLPNNDGEKEMMEG